MKKNPDGTPLVDDVPFDPYATIVGTSADIAPPSAVKDDAESVAPIGDDATASQSAISVPDDALEIPPADPLKTMYVSDAEMKQVLGSAGDAPAEEIRADEAEAEAPVLELPSVPEPPPPSFTDMSPPPSPFSDMPQTGEAPVPAPPVFLEPETTSSEADTVIPPEVAAAAMGQPPAPVQGWTPPAPPEANWQNQQFDSNAPPPAGAGQSKMLAIISLIVGILSIPLCFLWISPLTGLVAIITGVLAVKKASSDPTRYGGKALAIIGIILGVIFLLLGLALWMIMIVVGPNEIMRWAEEQQRLQQGR